jgi:hypothetical protein
LSRAFTREVGGVLESRLNAQEIGMLNEMLARRRVQFDEVKGWVDGGRVGWAVRERFARL